MIYVTNSTMPSLGSHYANQQTRLRGETEEDARLQNATFGSNKHRQGPSHATLMAYKSSLIPAGK